MIAGSSARARARRTRSSETGPIPPSGWSHSSSLNPTSLPNFTAEFRSAAERVDVERERHREILDDRQAVEEHGPVAHDAEAVHDRQPLLTGLNRAGGAAEQDDLAGVRQHRAGDEVDEDFGHRLIEADEGYLLSGRDGEPLDP